MIIGDIFKSILGGAGTVDKAIDLAGKFVVDKDKRDSLIVDLVRVQAAADMQTTIPWVDALHKMGRQLLWFSMVGAYFYCKLRGIPMDLSELAMIAAGPAVYTVLKGKGQ